MSLTYREYVVQKDVRNVRDIVESSGFFSTAEVEIAVELVRERLSKGNSSGYSFLFAEQDGRVVGYTCFGPIAGTLSSYDLYWIAVHNDARGKGIGRELLQKTEKIIADQGGTQVYTETSSRGQYRSTRKFYLSCGYQEEAILRDFYAPGDNKVIYVKVIHL